MLCLPTCMYWLVINHMTQMVLPLVALHGTSLVFDGNGNLLFYINLGLEPPLDWPKEGAISVENISVRYAQELDPVLKGVDVVFNPGEKVSVCVG